MAVASEPGPPPAPRIEHRVSLRGWQWLGIPLLLLVPVLAVFGVFGTSYTSIALETAHLSVDIGVPTRLRYKMLGRMEFDVTNRTALPIDTVAISVDTTYLSRFSTVLAVPDFRQPYRIELTELGPGETRRAMIELQAEGYGRHRGEIAITTPRESTTVAISSVVFP